MTEESARQEQSTSLAKTNTSTICMRIKNFNSPLNLPPWDNKVQSLEGLSDIEEKIEFKFLLYIVTAQ